MALVNNATGEVTAKLVYYGPGLCGKTTNLEKIYANPKLAQKGKLISMSTETDRTLFFDFMPLELGTIGGKKLRVQLYTVPGQVFYDATRKLVLRGADGVVFVADSQESMRNSNLESLENLRANLRLNRIDPDRIALVYQYNKRDLPTALPVEEISAYLQPGSAPVIEAVAIDGIGVMPTLRQATAKILENLTANVDISLPDAPDLEAPDLSAGSGVVYATSGTPKLTVIREPEVTVDIDTAGESPETVPFVSSTEPVPLSVPALESALAPPAPVQIPRMEDDSLPPNLPIHLDQSLLSQRDVKILLDDSRAIIRALELALDRAREQERQLLERLES